MFFKKNIKNKLLRFNKSIHLDKDSQLNYQVINKTINHDYPCKIYSSTCNSGYSINCENLRHFSIKLKLGFFTNDIHSATSGSNFSLNCY